MVVALAALLPVFIVIFFRLAPFHYYYFFSFSTIRVAVSRLKNGVDQRDALGILPSRNHMIFRQPEP